MSEDGLKEDAEKYQRETFEQFRKDIKWRKSHAPKLSKLKLPQPKSAPSGTTSTIVLMKATSTGELSESRTLESENYVVRYDETPKIQQPMPYTQVAKSYIPVDHHKNKTSLLPVASSYFTKAIDKALKSHGPEEDKEPVFQKFAELNHIHPQVWGLQSWYNEAPPQPQKPVVIEIPSEINNNNEIDNDSKCSPECFKNKPSTEISPFWTVAETYQLWEAAKTYGLNYCAISQAIGTKSCFDVHQKAKGIEWRTSDKVLVKSRKSLREKMHFFQKRNGSNYKTTEISYYSPCSHDGPCGSNCPCYAGKNFCEKFCSCAGNCENRNSGCDCKALCNSKLCPCVVADRECDASICSRNNGNCHQCSNMNLLKRAPKQVEVKLSTIPGIGHGLFASEDIQKHEFIIEYTGELVSREEETVRSTFYSEMKKTYLFALCKEYSIDAFFMGNESRFINHSEKGNCYPKIITTNGEKRVVFFAERNIQKGEELFFCYNFSDEHKEMYLGVDVPRR